MRDEPLDDDVLKAVRAAHEDNRLSEARARGAIGGLLARLDAAEELVRKSRELPKRIALATEVAQLAGALTNERATAAALRAAQTDASNRLDRAALAAKALRDALDLAYLEQNDLRAACEAALAEARRVAEADLAAERATAREREAVLRAEIERAGVAHAENNTLRSREDALLGQIMGLTRSATQRHAVAQEVREAVAAQITRLDAL